jgi:hypothetical protein
MRFVVALFPVVAAIASEGFLDVFQPLGYEVLVQGEELG